MSDPIERLLSDLADQVGNIERTYAEGRGAWQNQLVSQLHHLVRAAASAAERAAEDATLPEATRRAARRLAEAELGLEKQSVPAARYLAELSEGWACGRCGETTAKAAKVERARGPVVLECAACGAETPVTSAGAEAFSARFGHLAAQPGWNPETNGFRRR